MDAVNSRTTIAELLASHPRVRDVLAAKGIDTCCGGSLTLAQAADARGIPVTELLEALTVWTSRPPLVHRSDTVRNVLATYPATASVFEKHGLMGCGGAAGPDEPIDLFAVIHRVDVAQLLAELNDAVERPAHDKRPALEQAAPVYPAFLKAALVATMTLGATFGAYNLMVIHWALGPIPSAHTWTHAAFQLWGFILLFIMGVSYHAVPRFFGVNLQNPVLARSTLWISIAALLLMTWGRFDEVLPATVPALGAGAALQFLAVLGWAIVLSATWRHATPAPDLFQPFLAAGTLWWLVAAALLAAGAGSAVWHGGAAWAADWNEAVYAAALFGGTLGWIQGMFLRTGPVFLNLSPTRPRAVALAFWMGQVGAALTTLGGAVMGHERADAFADAGLLAMGASVVAFVVGVRPFSSRTERLSPRDRQFIRLVRLAFGASILFAVLASSYSGLDLAGRTPERLVYDGMRHAFALGFVTLMILAMAGRILPIFGGADLQWPVLHAWGGYLIAVALVLREAEVAVAWLGAPWLLNVSGASGIVAAAGVCAASGSILGTLRTASRLDKEPISPAAVPIVADVNVARLIAAHPEAVPILVEAGFTPLADPVLRRTLARAVTLREACRMRGIDLEGVLERLRGASPNVAVLPTLASRAPLDRPQAPQLHTGAETSEAVAGRRALPVLSSRLPLDPQSALGVLQGVIDPELGMNVVDLGLIYDLTLSPDGSAAVRMTVTSPGCPHAQHLVDAVHQALSAVPSVRAVDVDLVFHPPWSPDRMSATARARLETAGRRRHDEDRTIMTDRCPSLPELREEGPLSRLARTAPVLELTDPLAAFLGALPPDGTFCYTYEDAVKLCGHSCPTVAGAYLMTAVALERLYGPRAIPVRGDVEVTIGGTRDDGAAGPMGLVAGLITGAAPETGFGGLRGRWSRRNLLRFDPALEGRMRFRRRDTGAAVELTIDRGGMPAPPEMPALMAAALGGHASPEETRRFKELWHARVEEILTVDPRRLVSVRELDARSDP